jgi:hypothetical protein
MTLHEDRNGSAPDGPSLPSRRTLLGLAGLLAGSGAALAAPGDSPAPSTATARLALARDAIEAVRANIGRGLFQPGERDPIYIWSQRRLEARLDLSPKKADRIAAAQEHLDEMKKVEDVVGRMHAAGAVDRLPKLEAEYRRLEAEGWLQREKEKT